ncbi:unnamed protein product [Cuscuta epithymum]|uniref:Uncharacterized protein n=1 Tax=Cuscuta epithymum TaxID=186058 RepID=A0AAV0D521_9ASTE|nr:unnamed protein product [Cuscuta epithymum]
MGQVVKMNADLQKKKSKNEIDRSSEKRSPLLDCNKNPKLSSKNTNLPSSFSSYSFVEASKSSPRFLLSSSNSSSAASSQKWPASFLRAKSANPKSGCSKENIFPRPTSQKPKKSAPSTSQRQSGRKTISRASKKPMLPADLVSSGKNSRSGSRKIAAKNEDSKTSWEIENGSGKHPNHLTPVGKLFSGSGLDCANSGGDLVHESSKNAVKTPPIEPSVSPEIPCGLSSAKADSATTPCYGAGHVLSGVADKRKCRPRGVLTVGPALDLLSSKSGKSNENNKKSRTSFAPLPVEASMCWMSSPSGEGDGDVIGSKTKSGSEITQFCGLMGCLTLGGQFSLISSPQTVPSCKDAHLHLSRKCSCSFSMDNSPNSTSTLSCGNVIQTPNSDSSSGRHFGSSLFNMGEEHNLGRFEYEAFGKSSFSPQDQIEISNSTTTFSFVSNTPTHKKLEDTSASWHSDSSSGSESESTMRVSWKDVLDGLDSCRCPSDEENNNVVCPNDQAKLNQSFEGSDYEYNDHVMKKVLKYPKFLEQEPFFVYKNGKENVLPQRRPGSSCAESIITDGGGLVSSTDSDWNLCCNDQIFRP